MIDEIAREIFIKSKKRIFNQNLGNNATTFIGNGLDFHELREYCIGDDVRKINWKASAKEGKFYINLFTEERELNIISAFMSSGSISFGSKRIKQELMSEILTILNFSAIKNGDSVKSLCFSDRENYFKNESSKISSLYDTLSKIIKLDTRGKKVNFKKFSEYILSHFKEKSIIFIIGDFFEDVDLTLLSEKYEIFAIIVRDKFEEDPKLDGIIDLIDPNNLSTTKFDFNQTMIDNYKKKIENRDKKVIEHFLEHRINWTKIYTDEDPFYKINNLVR